MAETSDVKSSHMKTARTNIARMKTSAYQWTLARKVRKIALSAEMTRTNWKYPPDSEIKVKIQSQIKR